MITSQTPTIAELARAFAVERHGAQRYGVYPYVLHLDEVHGILHEFSVPWEECYPAAYLHDILEDTGTSVEEVYRKFGTVATAIVLFCTDSPGQNRKEKKLRTYHKIRLLTYYPCGNCAAAVKIADRLANVRACLRDPNEAMLKTYRKEHVMFTDAMASVKDTPFICTMWQALTRLLNDH